MRSTIYQQKYGMALAVVVFLLLTACRSSDPPLLPEHVRAVIQARAEKWYNEPESPYKLIELAVQAEKPGVPSAQAISNGVEEVVCFFASARVTDSFRPFWIHYGGLAYRTGTAWRIVWPAPEQEWQENSCPGRSGQRLNMQRDE